METAFFAIVCNCLRSAIYDHKRLSAIIWKPGFNGDRFLSLSDDGID